MEEKRRSVEAVWVRISRCGLAVMEGSHGLTLQSRAAAATFKPCPEDIEILPVSMLSSSRGYVLAGSPERIVAAACDSSTRPGQMRVLSHDSIVSLLCGFQLSESTRQPTGAVWTQDRCHGRTNAHHGSEALLVCHLNTHSEGRRAFCLPLYPELASRSLALQIAARGPKSSSSDGPGAAAAVPPLPKEARFLFHGLLPEANKARAGESLLP